METEVAVGGIFAYLLANIIIISVFGFASHRFELLLVCVSAWVLVAVGGVRGYLEALLVQCCRGCSTLCVFGIFGICVDVCDALWLSVVAMEHC